MTDNSDITETCKPKSDQLNADELLGGPITIKIRDQKVNATLDQPVSLYFDGDEGRPWKPNKSMRKILKAIWGGFASQYVGKSLTLYREATVSFGGAEVGGIQFSHAEGLEKPYTCSINARKGGYKKSFTIQPLVTKDEPKIDVEAVNTAARGEAEKGKSAFIKWYQSNAATRDLVKPIMTELQETAAKADAASAADETPETEGDDNGPAI